MKKIVIFGALVFGSVVCVNAQTNDISTVEKAAQGRCDIVQKQYNGEITADQMNTQLAQIDSEVEAKYADDKYARARYLDLARSCEANLTRPPKHKPKVK